MKKNKKGFTLVELLAVIVILGLIMVVVTPAVLNILNNSKKQAFYLYAQSIESKALNKYLNDDSEEANENTMCYTYNIKTDLDLNNTGSYEGWAQVKKEANYDEYGTISKEISTSSTSGSASIKYVKYCITDGKSSTCTPDKSYGFEEGATNVTVKVKVPTSDTTKKYSVCVLHQYVVGNKLYTNDDGCSSTVEKIASSYSYSIILSLTNQSYAYKGVFSEKETTLEKFKQNLVKYDSATGITISDCDGNTLTIKNNEVKKCSNDSLTADQKKYNIILNANGGTMAIDGAAYSVKAIETCVGCSGQTLPTPTKESNGSSSKFLGWYYSKEFKTADKVSGSSTSDLKTSAKKNTAGCIEGYNDINLYALWSDTKTAAADSKTCSSDINNTWNILFDVNGGDEEVSSICVNCAGYSATDFTTPVRKGYTFKGWYLSKTSSDKVSNSRDVSTTQIKNTAGCVIGYKDVIIYARWTKNQTTVAAKTCKEYSNEYNILFDLNGGTNGPATVCVNCSGYDSSKEFSSPTRSGYTFKGWYKSKNFKDSEKVISPAGIDAIEIKATSGCITGYKDVTIYAKWEKNKSTITEKTCKSTTDTTYYLKFDLNGGTNGQSSICVNCKNYENTSFKQPVRTGYTFAGWYKDKSFTTKAEGTLSDDIPSVAVKSAAGCITGYKDITLYAKWTKNSIAENVKTCAANTDTSYYLKFDFNGGTDGQDLICVNCYNYTNTKFKEPTRIGYSFAGWYYDDDYTKAVESIWSDDIPAVTIKSAAGCVTGYKDIELHAKWKALTTATTIKSCSDSSSNKYYIRFNLNGGTSTQKDICVNCDGYVATDILKPTRDKYTFLGWYYDKEFKNKLEESNYNSAFVTPSPIKTNAGCANGYNDVNLYAKWQKGTTTTKELSTYKAITNSVPYSTYTAAKTTTTTETLIYTTTTTTTIDISDESLLLKNLSITGKNLEFNKLKFYYNFNVSYDTENITLNYTPMIASTTCKVIGSTKLNVGDNVIIVQLTNSNGKNSQYTITINRYNQYGERVTGEVKTTTKSGSASGLPDPTLEESNASLKMLSVSGYAFKFSSETYYYDLAINAEGPIYVIPTPYSDKAIVTVSDTSNVKAGDTVTINVTSENGYYTKKYTLNIKAKNTESTTTKTLKIVAIVLGSVLAISLIILNLLKNGKIRIKVKKNDDVNNTNNNV